MPRKSLAGVALFAALVGCRDGPTTVEVPVESQVAMTIPLERVLLAQQALDDPLVLEILQTLDDPAVADGFDGIRGELDRHTVRRDKLAVSRTLETARDFVGDDSEGTDIVLRDVLALVLDDVENTLLGDTATTQADENVGDPKKRGERVSH